MSAEIKNLSPQPVWGYFYDLTQIPRPTGHMEAVTRFMVAFGKGLGLETLQDEVGNVLIRKPASPGMEGHKTVTMQSHLDMVPQKNSSVKHDFLTDPIDAYIDGDWVKARETTLGADNGMGAAFAMAVLADKTLMHGPLEALFTINEEVGMDGAVGLKPGFLKGEILLNCDSEEEGELFVGCAGGADLNVSMQFKEDTYIPEGDVAVKISLTGLKGGHSGVDIHLGRANANKLMFRFLKEAVRDYGARLSSVDGGSLRNAIPREAFAVITIPGDNVEALWELVSDYREMYRYEYKGIEHNINFTAEMTEIQILVRSSSESRKEAVCSSLESIFSLAGAKVEYSDGYGGWQPNIDSPILKIMQQAYLDLYGKKPEAKVMHAGLECGIIQESYPDMDMISIGPDLQHPHSPDERVSIPSVARTWDFIVTTLARI